MDPTDQPEEAVRLDIWLRPTWLSKTRLMTTDACKRSHILNCQTIHFKLSDDLQGLLLSGNPWMARVATK